MRTGKEYLLYQYVSLTAALYDTPFYWLNKDTGYKSIAETHRGEFAEQLSADCLTRVFGDARVYLNVDLWRSKKAKIGEIDVLVVFGDRAIVVQAKSKKLTITARKGNDLQLRDDFKKAVQDAADQSYSCAEALLDPSICLTDRSGGSIDLEFPPKRVHPVCVVSDHYPALTFQCHQFLSFETSDSIVAPLVCDVFTLDAITEMLRSPLRCLSYLELRALAGQNVSMSHELVALSYHLQQNLWLGDHDFMLLEDNISAPLDVAMTVRRDGVQGESTPDGILTRLEGTTVGKLITAIEDVPNPAAIAIGLRLLQMSGETVGKLGTAITNLARAAKKDGKSHDVTMGFGPSSSGLTVHCNAVADDDARKRLKAHCDIRKYSQKADSWYGISIDPKTKMLRFGLALEFPWEYSEEPEAASKSMSPGIKPKNFSEAIGRVRTDRRKIGRNDPYPCGSGKKYKKCCLGNTRTQR